MINVGIVGFGKFGRYIFSILEKINYINVIGICDYDNNINLPQINFYNNIDDLIVKQRLDILFVLTDPYRRVNIIEKAILNNIFFYVEKPVCCCKDDLDKIVKLLNRNEEKLFYISSIERNNPYFVAVKNLYDSNELGRLKYIDCQGEISRMQPMNGGWLYNSSLGGGATLESLIHYLDLIYSITKKKFSDFSVITQQNVGEVFNYDETVFGHGVVGEEIIVNFNITFCSYHKYLTSKVKFVFEEGIFDYSLDRQPLIYYGNNTMKYGNRILYPNQYVDVLRKGDSGLYKLQIDECLKSYNNSIKIFNTDDIKIPLEALFEIQRVKNAV